MSLRRLFVITGDASGDIHGAEVIHQIQRHLPQVDIQAIGGTHIASTGVRLLYHQRKMGALGLAVFGAIPSHWMLAKRLLRHFDTWQPDAVLLIDYGIFNLWMAKQLKQRGIKVFYYIPPQVWASRAGRIKTIQRYVDHVFCIFPFEQKLYEDKGIPVTYVGHPLAEQLTDRPHRETFCYTHGLDPLCPIVGIFPGSRKAEVKSLLPAMLQATPMIQAQFPMKLQFLVAQSPAVDEAVFDAILTRFASVREHVTLKIVDNANRDILALSQAALVASGTVTLEAALYKTPVVIAYKMPWLGYFLFRQFGLVKSIGLPNLLAKQPFLPELLMNKVSPKEFTKAVLPYLTDTPERQKALAAFDDIRAQLGAGSASYEVVKGMANLLHEPFVPTRTGPVALTEPQPEHLDLQAG